MSFNPQLLRILHLASPALPIGAFHFSQGLEYAVVAGWVRDEGSALEWVGGLSDGALGTLDLPILARLHEAWTRNDHAAIRRWDALLIAARETEELRAEDRHMGAALLKVLKELDVDRTISGVEADRLSYAAAFALACVHWGVTSADTLQAFAWAWAENQVLAAVKLVPLGQSAGQRILHALIPRLTKATGAALQLHDDDIGFCAVMQGIASARHESQYTRLFRS